MFQIVVSVENATVTLTGKTSNEALKTVVADEIAKLPGVKINDLVEVLPADELGSRTWPTWGFISDTAGTSTRAAQPA